MNGYKNLTKKEIRNGVEEVLCKFDGTDWCQLHNHDCKNCTRLKCILMQLNAFEEVYK